MDQGAARADRRLARRLPHVGANAPRHERRVRRRFLRSNLAAVAVGAGAVACAGGVCLVGNFRHLNVAPDLNPWAMSSYWDMLNRNAFGNYRTLLKDVTLHPAMGYYLNMINSRKENTRNGTHPNENYTREVLQLFSIGLVKLNLDGTPQLDAGLPI